MKWMSFLVVFTLLVTSCRGPEVQGTKLAPTSVTGALVVIRQPTVTLYWTNLPNPNLTVTVWQSPNVSAPLAAWNPVATVSNSNSVTVPVTSAAGMFAASGVSSSAQLSWDYPVSLLTPTLSFNLYWRPDSSQNWMLATNVTGGNLSARVYPNTGYGQFAVSATDATMHAESPLSNVVPWTNQFGIHLGIRQP